MKTLYMVKPEVAGGWGPNTIVSNRMELKNSTTVVPIVAHLEYRFDGWFGDNILEATPCFIVTDALATSMEVNKITGFRLEDVEVTTSDEFEQFRKDVLKNAELPQFRRLVPEGNVFISGGAEVQEWSGHDVCFGQRVDWVKPVTPAQMMQSPARFGLVVSDKCLNILRQFPINHCEIESLHIP